MDDRLYGEGDFSRDVILLGVCAVGLDDRDYMNREHYPSCTCIACCRRRSERAAAYWCGRHDRPKGPSGCPACLLEGACERSPEGQKRKALRDGMNCGSTARKGAVGLAERDQTGNRLGRTLKGIQGKR